MKQNVIDKRALEHILTDQKNEITGRREESLCHCKEERLVDLGSPQAQVVIGVRHCSREGWDVYYLKERSGECDIVVCNGNQVLQCNR